VELRHYSASADPREVAAELRRAGAVIVDNAVSDELMDQLDLEAAPFIDATGHGRDEYDGTHTRRTGMLITRCPSARALIMHPMAVGVASDFLSHASAVQLHLTQLISIEPGETQQKLHRDQMAFDMFDFPADYHVQCNTMWALTEFTADNGATHVIPGSSTVDDDAAMRLPECRAQMSRGSVLFYDGKVIHGGGGNHSDGPRRGVNITYSVGWVRQEENQFLATAPEVARTLDDDLLRMMGYQQGAFALGYVGDNQDPLAYLRGEQGKVKTIGSMADGDDRYRQFADDAAAAG
jgi:ectoine hydroxylase-related dioxygenase (phytanoyl-CoA dioxygenase family)